MSGIILILVALLWVVIAFVVVWLIGKLLPEIWWAYFLRVVLFLALLPLPIVDELLGARQFEKLCKENSTIQVDRAKAAGTTVYLAEVRSVQLKGTWVPIWIQPWRFVDATTGETVVSYNQLRASSGIVWPASFGPLTFKGFCAPGGGVDALNLFKEIGVTQIQRSELSGRDKK